MKTTINTPPKYKKSNLNFIYEYIQKYNRLPKHIYSQSLLHYYTSQLRQKRLINKAGYGVWTTTNNAPLTSTKMHHVAKNIRGHGYHIRLQIPKLKNWDKRQTYLKRSEMKYTPIPQGQRVIIREHKIWLCSKAIIIYYPKDKSFYAITAQEAEDSAIFHFEGIIRSLENKLHCSFKINGNYHIRISKNHYAKIKDDMAKYMNDRKEKITCYLDNKNWLVIDHSLNVDETETLNPVTAKGDMDNLMVPFLNDLKQYYDKNNEVLLLSDIVKVQGMFASNITSHIKAIQDLSKFVKELRDQLKKNK